MGEAVGVSVRVGFLCCRAAVELHGWKGLWRKIAMTGTPPSPRSGHSFTAITNRRVVVFGGCGPGSPSTSLLNDMHLLDCGTQRRVPTRAAVAADAFDCHVFHRRTAVRNHVVDVISFSCAVFVGGRALGVEAGVGHWSPTGAASRPQYDVPAGHTRQTAPYGEELVQRLARRRTARDVCRGWRFS